MIHRYWSKEMRFLWETNSRKFYYWLLVELAVLEARENLEEIPKGVHARVREIFESIIDSMPNPMFQEFWDQVTSAIEKRDRTIHHDLNAFIEIMRAMIILSNNDFRAMIYEVDDEKFDKMLENALAHVTDNSDASYFHDGMTSYDTEEPALALLFQDSCSFINNGIAKLEMALKSRAVKHRGQLMVGRTHGQHAQPITFGIKCLNWLDMVQRSQMAIWESARKYEVMKLSGAVGVYGTLGPEVEECLSKRLRLNPVIATQIIPIDYRARIVSEMAIFSSVIEKIANDLWLMSQTEVGEIREPFGKKQKGSSAMPHKKNPISLEKLRGLSSIVRGFSIAMNELIATSHERDISHSSAERIIHQTVFAVIDHQISVLTYVINEMTVFPEKMLENIEMTYSTISSQKLEMLLKEKGIGAEEAYRTVQEACFEAVNKKIHLKDIIRNNSPVFELVETGVLTYEEIVALFDWREWIQNEDFIYQRAGINKDVVE